MNDASNRYSETAQDGAKSKCVRKKMDESDIRCLSAQPANKCSTSPSEFEERNRQRTKPAIVDGAKHLGSRGPGALNAKIDYRGWTQMLCCMKAFVEYGINLREGMFK